MLKNLFVLMISPKVGWEYIDDSGHSADEMLRGLLFPLLGILAVACFVPMLYNSATNTLTSCLVVAVIHFSKYVLTYFVTSYLLSGFYPVFSKSNIALTRLNGFVVYNIAFLVVLDMVNMVINADFTPLRFLVLWVVWLCAKGTEMLGFAQEKRVKFVAVASAMIIGLPFVFQKVMEMVIAK